MKDFTTTELLQFLQDIETGLIKLKPLRDPQDIFAGDVEYNASNGWKMVVFNDANEWDYIDEITDAAGRSVDYDRLCASFPAVANYEPIPEVAWQKYWIPGYCKFRCWKCDATFHRNQFLQEHRLTSGCGDLLALD